MKSYNIEVLKQIALKGGIHDYVSMSTKKLGDMLNISQQSASNRMLELSKLGMVMRDVEGRAQKVKLTEKGMGVLRREFADYQHIFELEGILSIRGALTSGLGEGQYYMQQKGYYDQFVKKLKFRPYIGTLNLKLSGAELAKVDVLRNMGSIRVEGFKDGARTFGDVRAYPALIKNLECAVIMPDRSHHIDVLEVISPHFLRKKAKLTDGDIVELHIPVK
jgi:riboflavin kinase